MKIFAKIALMSLFVLSASGCSSSKDPGQLAGTWEVTGGVFPEVTFRTGEMVSAGMPETVSYKISGNGVLVTHLDGSVEGYSKLYTITGPDSAKTDYESLRRIR